MDNPQSHPIKDYPHPTYQGQPQATKWPKSRSSLESHKLLIIKKELLTHKSSKPMLLHVHDPPVPWNPKFVAVAQDVMCPPRRVKFQDSIGICHRPCTLPKEVFNFKFMPLIWVKKLAISFNPNSPYDNAPKEVQNFKPRFAFLLDAMPNHVVLPIKFMTQVLPSAPELKENLYIPLPNFYNLDAFPKSMFEGFFGGGKTISTWSRNVDWKLCTPFIDCHCLVPNEPNEGCLLTNFSFVTNTHPSKLVDI